MGFSVSGAAAIIFATMFIAFGMWFTAASNSFESVTEAQQAQTDNTKSAKNTDIEVLSAEYNGTHLVVDVDNAGATQLSLDDTDLVVDGSYVSDWQDNATVEGDSSTRLWLTGERLTIELERSEAPGQVKVVADTGISDTMEVTDTS